MALSTSSVSLRSTIPSSGGPSSLGPSRCPPITNFRRSISPSLEAGGLSSEGDSAESPGDPLVIRGASSSLLPLGFRLPQLRRSSSRAIRDGRSVGLHFRDSEPSTWGRMPSTRLPSVATPVPSVYLDATELKEPGEPTEPIELPPTEPFRREIWCEPRTSVVCQRPDNIPLDACLPRFSLEASRVARGESLATEIQRKLTRRSFAELRLPLHRGWNGTVSGGCATIVGDISIGDILAMLLFADSFYKSSIPPKRHVPRTGRSTVWRNLRCIQTMSACN